MFMIAEPDTIIDNCKKKISFFIKKENMAIWILYLIILIVIVLSIILFILYRKMFNPKSEIINSDIGSYKDIYHPLGNRKGDGYNKSKRPNIPCFNSWYFDKHQSKKVILYLHGNIGNNSHRTYVIDACDKLKIDLFLVDYRGFGRSNKHPTPEGVCEDAESAYLFLRNIVKPKNIIIWGESLGGSAAIYVASKYKCSSLVVVSSFSSIDDILTFDENSNPWLGKILKYITNPFPSKDWIKKVKCPTIILHSKKDKMIPYKCAEELHKCCSCKNKKLIEISGDHSSPDISEKQLQDILSFCNIAKSECELSNVTDIFRKAGENCFKDYL